MPPHEQGPDPLAGETPVAGVVPEHKAPPAPPVSPPPGPPPTWAPPTWAPPTWATAAPPWGPPVAPPPPGLRALGAPGPGVATPPPWGWAPPSGVPNAPPPPAPVGPGPWVPGPMPGPPAPPGGVGPPGPRAPLGRVPDNVPFLDVPGVPPTTKGDAGVWLVIALAGFVVAEVLGAIFTLFGAAVTGNTRHLSALESLSSPPEWLIVTGLLGLWVGFGGSAVLASVVRGTRNLVVDLGLRFRWIDLTGIVWGVLAQILVGLAYLPFEETHRHSLQAPTEKLTGSSYGWGYFVIAGMTIVGAPFFEELFFRGLLFKSLARLCTPRVPSRGSARVLGLGAAMALDGLLFGGAHGELIQLPALAVFGAILAFMSYRTGRLGMNMISHASFNAIPIIVLALSFPRPL